MHIYISVFADDQLDLEGSALMLTRVHAMCLVEDLLSVGINVHADSSTYEVTSDRKGRIIPKGEEK